MKQPFFSFDLHQQVNQWLCLALIAFAAFLVVLYYLVNRAEAFGNNYVSNVTVIDTAPVKHRVIKSQIPDDLSI